MFLFFVLPPFTHPRKDPLEAVVQWNLVVKDRTKSDTDLATKKPLFWKRR
jgi:hypothetical protein